VRTRAAGIVVDAAALLPVLFAIPLARGVDPRVDRLEPWIASNGAGAFVSAAAVERAGERDHVCFMTESILD